jgi:hypothetical protein
VRGGAFILNVTELTANVRATERKAIDDAFRPMASDKRYQREALRLAEQFGASDAEVIELAEKK